VFSSSAQRGSGRRPSGLFMNLSAGISRYVAHKKVDGVVFKTGEQSYRDFVQRVGDIQMRTLSTLDLARYAQVTEFPPHNSVRGFRSQAYKFTAEVFAAESCALRLDSRFDPTSVAELSSPLPLGRVLRRPSTYAGVAAELASDVGAVGAVKPFCGPVGPGGRESGQDFIGRR
jgi:hypothetical protein